MTNPFTLTFGKKPELMIERYEQIDRIVNDFKSESPTSQVYMITGIRGSGKTVMMTSINKALASDDWINIELNSSSDDLLKSFASQLYSKPTFNKIFTNMKLDLSVLGIGVSIEGSNPISDYETAIEKMLVKYHEKGKRVLVSIDEVSNTKAIKIFASSFQIFVRKDLPLYLIMTGLYENIESLQNDKNLTFLYRAERIYLTNLSLTSIANKYAKVFNDCPIIEMAKLTNGYAYAFQALGYLMWESKEKTIDSILDEYDERLSDYVYRKIWSEASEIDKQIFIEIANNNLATKSISEVINKSSSMISNYKKKYIKKGIVEECHSEMHFSLPRFKEFVLLQSEFE